MTPADVTPASPEEAVALWREMDVRLTNLRLRLEEVHDEEAVPSYRVGAAEGFTIFHGLGELGHLVEESFRELQEELVPQASNGDDPARS